MAPVRLNALHPLAAAVTGVSAGAITTLLLPGGLGAAAGLLLCGGGLIGTARLYERRLLAQREQVFAGLGEVKVRLATNAIRLDNLSQRVEQMPMREADAAPARAAINELTAEVGLLGDLIHQVATTLADHDAQLTVAQARQAPPAKPAPVPVIDPEAARQARLDAIAAEREEAERAAQRRAADKRAAVISTALSEGKVEVHLQPIVQLPQRRTRGYEALVRLRVDENTLLLPEDFLAIVEQRGFGPTLDALVLTRALAIARHLGTKQGGLFVSCNFSDATWGSSKALATLSRILDKYREHNGHLVVEMPQRVFRALDPASLGLLGAMSANGVRFALDQVADLRFDPIALFDRGIRFVKAPATLFQAEMAGEGSLDIAAGDLASMMARASIALIADEIADNPTVADMIELGITYAQGLIFSPPRPVKPEVFAEPEVAPPAAESEAALARPTAEVLGYPPPAASPAQDEAKPERQSFRSVLRRASA
ncbi:EAL domain-containing protein [Bosea psychrotolerans]|uniref:Cyclic-di-GMP phosphodiesterase TipF (Flagellum assembly factor) n=1 Tax=Bosea psychrotolerans TaxID=1871628 RepID=A0A2S4M4M2_9HYPH|nr:EAL domain-containing protein [Bosea psychrotolerans]POR49595.1 cyclic-di-GMP phosphodiesterase TipF (flagellum assembly factor) [Bosea psychrotolerans]